MKAFKYILFLVLTLMLVILAVSCGESDKTDEPAVKNNDKTVTLNVYNWGEYISDGFEGCPDVNALFEDYYYEKFGVKVEVNYTTYATNEDMYSKLSSGAGTYDIVIPSDYMIQRMADEGLLYDFGAENIENYVHINDQFKGLYYDKENRYSVPYTYGMVGIIYNYTMLDPEDLDEDFNIKDETWGLMWNEKYAGKILQFNNPRDAFGTAMYYHNLDINSSDKSVWEEALGYLKDQKPLVQGYVNDEIYNKMGTGSAAIAAYFAGDYITMLEDNEYLKFYYPKEGTNVFVDAMCIPAYSTQKEIAMEYINFMLSEEIAVANALYIGYASPNELVVNNEDYIAEMGEDAIAILYGSSSDGEVNANYSFDPFYYSFTDASIYEPGFQEYVNGLWETLKTESAIEPWIHVTSITIVTALLVIASYSLYIKKKRSRFYRYRDREAQKEK